MISRLALLIAFACIQLTVSAQKKPTTLFLKAGKVAAPDLSAALIDSFNHQAFRLNKAFAIIQFDEIPSDEMKKELSAQGIDLLNYVPDNAYTVSIRKELKLEALKKMKARAVVKPLPQQKMDASLAKGMPPGWAVKVNGTVDVFVSVPKVFKIQEVIAVLKGLNIEVISSDLVSYHLIGVRIAINRLPELADLPYVEYVQSVPPEDQPLNLNSRSLSHANVLNASIANGGKGLNGEGVVMGVGDNADVQFHTDFAGRLINRAVGTHQLHGTHVTGIAAGAGIVNEQYRGYAPKATIVSQIFNGIFFNAPTYVQDYGMVVTNNSYGAIIGCDYNGTYDLYSYVLDQQAFDYPYLQHVFASGNSGGLTCAPFPAGFRTVLGAYQSAKNILCVGNTDLNGNIYSSSSKGPVRDGRLKPEITAQGLQVTSSSPTNSYATVGGTSMSSPAVSGGMALLYQRYRQLNGNANPKSALMKALMCNGASDKGNSGPDYSYGFGSMNLLRSVDMLENNRFFTGNAANGGTYTHTISVPANTAHLKVMLYWHDPAASLLSPKALVNDVDLEVVDPSLAVQLPYILDSTAANVNNVATTGADHANNIEQVIVNAPASGTYTIRVKGTAITQNPTQEYFVVYDAIPNSIKMTYPSGGEGIAPAQSVRINWESYGDAASTFTLQYSTDGGSNWTDINTAVAATERFYTWAVPSVNTDNALVRVIKNATAQSSTSNAFSIIGAPTVSLAAVQCEGYIAINWTAVTGATDYEVMMLQGDEMVSMATTAATTYTINGLSKDSTYWVSVRARINGKNGMRAAAVSRKPDNGSCAGAISDNDLKLNAIVLPVSGRKNTSTELTAASLVRVEVKNLDDAVINNFTIEYSTDGGATWTPEVVSTPVAAGATYTHTFAATANLSAVGSYHIVAVVRNSTADAFTKNDVLSKVVRQLDNQPIDLATAFIDNLETATAAAYENDTIGLSGLDRYDFSRATSVSRVRTFVNTGIAYSGSKAFTFDVKQVTTGDHVKTLTGTYNLSGYNASSDELRLDFQFNSHGSNKEDDNKVWVRGNDTQPWIEVHNLYPDLEDAYGSYKLSKSIEIGDSLLAHGQNFSSSFQVKWTQNTIYPATDLVTLGGITIDDIRLYEVVNDVQMLSIDTPANLNCALNTTVPLKVTVRNGTSATLTNVPVKYSVDGGSWVTETIPSLAGNTSLQYTFTNTLDLSALGYHTITVLADLAGDSYRQNDTIETTIHNAALINSFPYLQNFEANNGGWFTEGTNNTWAYGTPASTKINGAASGAKAWKTRLSGNYNDRESSYLYSPCFDITGMSAPTLSFSLALDLENCGASICDGAWIEYSTDGTTWTLLKDNAATGTNWYNGPGGNYWSIENYTRWHVASVSLPTGLSTIRLRFVMSADPGVNREGIAIDDIHIYNNTKGIYTGSTLGSSISQTVSGNSWIDFETGSKLVASIQPNNQNMGTTDVHAYINSGSVRNINNQYYHDRSITIKPANTSLADSVTIRFYFLDSETETLINASGCGSCTKPSDAYDLGVAQYDDSDPSIENGTVSDNSLGLWTFFNATKVSKVPFDKGYYAEFKVKDFSEFWLSVGGLNQNVALPVRLVGFSVHITAGDEVQVNWKAADETNVSRYEVQVARSTEDLQKNKFEKIGEVEAVNAASAQDYKYTDAEPFKTGSRYYRVKAIDKDGSFKYTEVRSVLFENDLNWQLFPNPSATGIFSLVYQLNDRETVTYSITDAMGRKVKSGKISGNGFAQKQQLDLSGSQYAAGVYILKVEKEGKSRLFKLYKQ